MARMDFTGVRTRRDLEDAVKNVGWTMLHAGDTFDIAAMSDALVVATAPWSTSEMEVLQDLAVRTRQISFAVFVVDIDECLEEETYRRLLPYAAFLSETPALAVYSEGALVRFYQGLEAELELATISDMKRH